MLTFLLQLGSPQCNILCEFGCLRIPRFELTQRVIDSPVIKNKFDHFTNYSIIICIACENYFLYTDYSPVGQCEWNELHLIEQMLRGTLEQLPHGVTDVVGAVANKF